MAEITTNSGHVTLVDEEDFARFSHYGWSTFSADQEGPERRYVCRSVWSGGASRQVYLHREIMGAAEGQLVDHINGDPLDNRRANLRLCTRRQNSINRAYPLPPSGYRGVHQQENGQFYRARLEVEGVVIRVTGRMSAEAAARAYDALAREFQGEFAVLNFPRRERAA